MKNYMPHTMHRRSLLRGADGYAALIALVITLTASLAIVSGLTVFALQEVKANRIFVKSQEAAAASESGLEDGAYRLLTSKQIAPSETLVVGEGATTITTTTIGSEKTIRSEGSRDALRRIQEIKLITTPGTSFVYGAQVGAGGLLMTNNSTVNGSVFSNGTINATGNSQITGDASATGASQIVGGPAIGGSARAHAISDAVIGGDALLSTTLAETTVGGNAYADTISQSTITGNAYYFTSISQSTVGGSTFPNTPPPQDVAPEPFPITDADISEWETQAATGGTHTTPCPYTITGTVTLGPRKIACDLTIQGSAVVTLTGPVWITGNADVKNTAIVRLDSSYENKSEVIIADNPANRTTSSKVTVQNSAQILGSGTPGSYVFLISQNNSAETNGNEIAIQPKNSAAGPIYYAPHGKILIQNITTLKEASAYAIEMKNSAALTYESGLASIRFSSGPTGAYDLVSWKEVE
ncbi:MAG: hypothetical protein HY472_01190 [Candidatus Sungbacteria bacterium]|nr:hypothetical protein [Candidatus Sungbacteria bacterium]